MNRWLPLVAAAAAVLGFSPPAPATQVSTGLVEQLLFLGDASRADRIPLAPAVFHANYNYGMYPVIFEPRPCLHGHLTVDGQPFHEQNLAVLYGVTAEFADETQLPGSTLTLRLRKRTPPAKSPYTLEQIVAASIQCVINQEGSLHEKRPLTVTIQGDGMATPDWAAKYATAYFHTGTPGEQSWQMAHVPGLRVEKCPRGDRAIVFEDGDAGSASPDHRQPVFIPYMTVGDARDDHRIWFVPVWPGDGWKEPLNILTRPLLPYYERWTGGIGGRTAETVAVAHQTPPGFPHHTGPAIHVDRRESGTHVELLVGRLDPDPLAGFIAGCVLTELPAAGQPLTITLRDSLPAEATGWQDGKSCKFVIDPETLTLTHGTIPGFRLAREPWGTPTLTRESPPEP